MATKEKTDLQLTDLSIEAIKDQLISDFDKLHPVLQIVNDNWKRLENFGKLLIAAKSKVPHGEWENWLADTFEGRLTLRTAQRWIADVKSPASADHRRAKDRERKATDPSLLKKSSVTVTTTEPSAPKCQTAPVEIVKPETESPPAVAGITECYDYVEIDSLVELILTSGADDTTLEQLADQLRMEADRVSPSRRGRFVKPPTIGQLCMALPERFSKELRLTCLDWQIYLQKKQGAAQIQSMRAWKAELDRMETMAHSAGDAAVSGKVKAAVAGGLMELDLAV